jgi:Neutral/alkaline non-lysosomal ceramidase, N-terminal
MRRLAAASLVLSTALLWAALSTSVKSAPASTLQVGFAQADITPDVAAKTVYLAGFGQNRKATGVHDPLFVRAIVLKDGDKKIALACVDLVGFFYPNVLHARKELADFHYVLVSSTHNHEGPDTLGLWGPTAFKSGVDADYLKEVESKIVQAIRTAEKNARPATVQIGSLKVPELLHDGREPYVLHDDLVLLRFFDAQRAKPLGLLVEWNVHPELLGGKNTLVSADHVGYTVNYLQKKYDCPVTYFTGTVGGLMTSLHVPLKDEQAKELADETFEKTERYGLALGAAADRALASAKPIQLTPFDVRSRQVFLPMQNRLYLAGRLLGVLDREGFLWNGNPAKAEPAALSEKEKPIAIQTEVALLRLGELEVAAIPGEIYPELVLGKVQDPVDPGADYPEAPIEPGIYAQLKGPHRMIIGLANDEIGYIIPKRQWDEKPPFCYGRTKAQYGESNSIGPDAAPILCKAFRELAESK